MSDSYLTEHNLSIVGQRIPNGTLYTGISVVNTEPFLRRKSYAPGFNINGQKREVRIPVISILDFNEIDPGSSEIFRKDGSASSVSWKVVDSAEYICGEGDTIDPKRITTETLSSKLFSQGTFPLKHGYDLTVRAGRIENGRIYTRKIRGNERPKDLDMIYVHVRVTNTGGNGSKEGWVEKSESKKD